jgi:hypothetical protein
MIGEAAVFFLISLELLFRTALHPAINLLRCTIFRFIKALNDKEILLVPNVLRINRIARAFAERQEIHCIQQIRLSHSVLSEEAVQFGGESDLHLLQILIV